MLSFLSPSVLDLDSGTGQTDKWTDRRTDALINQLNKHAYFKLYEVNIYKIHYTS